MNTIEYNAYLKPYFFNTELIINYDDNNHIINSATLQSNSLGIITLTENKIKVHILESEEQLANISYLSKHFPAILLNGITNKINKRNSIISEVKQFIVKQNVPLNGLKIIHTLFDILKKTK